MLDCPRCGARRLIPLSFAVYQRRAGAEVVFTRPIAKCSACGQRVFARIIARQRVPKSI